MAKRSLLALAPGKRCPCCVSGLCGVCSYLFAFVKLQFAVAKARHLEDSPSGLWRTPGTRVGFTPSGVQIPHPPLAGLIAHLMRPAFYLPKTCTPKMLTPACAAHPPSKVTMLTAIWRSLSLGKKAFSKGVRPEKRPSENSLVRERHDDVIVVFLPWAWKRLVRGEGRISS